MPIRSTGLFRRFADSSFAAAEAKLSGICDRDKVVNTCKKGIAGVGKDCLQ